MGGMTRLALLLYVVLPNFGLGLVFKSNEDPVAADAVAADPVAVAADPNIANDPFAADDEPDSIRGSCS
jgi:hypothetical protein